MIKNKKKLVITRVAVSKLRKSEVSHIGDRVIGIVQKHNPELLQIEPLFGLLVAKQPEIEKLKIRHGVDHVRLALKPLREKLVLCASAIRLHLRTLSKSHDEQDLLVLDTHINGYLRGLNASKNREELEDRINGFLKEVENNEELGEAIVDHGFMDFVDNLSMALKKVISTSAKRVDLISQRHKEPTKQIEDEILEAVELIFRELEIAPFRNTEVDYEPVINELDALMYLLRRKVVIRDARARRRREEKENQEVEDGMNEQEEESNESTATGASTEVQVTMDDDNGSTDILPTYLSSIKKLDVSSMAQPNGNGTTNDASDESFERKKTTTGFDDLTQQSSGGDNA